IQTRQGLFDMPTFITSINDNKILREKTAFCIKIFLKLMGVGYRHIPIKLKMYIPCTSVLDAHMLDIFICF
ncbi:hypothetical protein, partial [Bacillus wiedmannii]|uniref:hypothetical protein n=1 Tax=Bacillus wiedmannii TaxID=1890302 RepID=UPI001A9549B5